MERRQEAANAAQQDAVTNPRGVKREPETTKQTAAEENWSALCNLRVAEDTGRAGAMRSRNKHKVRRTISHVQSTTLQDDANVYSKSSLSFILDDQAASAAGDAFSSGGKRAAVLMTRSRSTGDLSGETARNTGSLRTGRCKQMSDGKRRARRPPSRICKYEGCEQYVVDQGLCVRHGGGKRCLEPDCTSRAKHQGRCWKHGGSTECKVPSCINRAKSRGFCWSHGGGTKCKTDNCEKIAISNGLCWAHGGGKRCEVDGCKRQAYERTDNLCNNHFQ